MPQLLHSTSDQDLGFRLDELAFERVHRIALPEKLEFVWSCWNEHVAERRPTPERRSAAATTGRPVSQL
jgi:hypothetical protein